MKYFIQYTLIAVMAWSCWSCATVEPSVSQAATIDPIESVLIATNIENTPVVSCLGITIFENKNSYLLDFEYDLNQLILSQADSLIKAMGFTAAVNEKPLPEAIINGLERSRKKRMELTRELRAQGVDALLFLEQGSAQAGLNYGHGSYIKDHGFFLVRTGLERRDQVKMPVRIHFLDLRTGRRKYKYITDGEELPEYIKDFAHIKESDDVTEADREILIAQYKMKVDDLINEIRALIKE
jgi:hypothetical protein